MNEGPFTGDFNTLPPSLPPRISIVTPSYNQEKYLEECIDSVLSQGYPNLEYVIMDGGSTDGSVEIIKKYEKYLTYWQSQPDGGQYQAINAGFARTTGEIMAWLNSDDHYHPNVFLKIACTFSEYQYVDWITGIRTIWGAEGEIQSMDRSTPYFSRLKYLSGNFGTPCIQQESTFWRRSLWERAGGQLNTKCTLAADAELWLRFFRYAPLYNLNAFTGGFRHHGDQRSVLQAQKYVEEIKAEINRELETLPAHTQFYPMPETLRVSLETYMNFAEVFAIPRFVPAEDSLWHNYLKAVTDCILKLHGGLEMAQVFLDEILLWDRDRHDLPDFFIKELQKQIVKKNMAEQLIRDGELYFKKGELAKALKATSEAINIWPTSGDGTNNLGVLSYHAGNIKEAIEYFVLATQYENGKWEAYRNLSIVFYELGQRDKIQWALEYYLTLFPEHREMEQLYRRLMECP